MCGWAPSASCFPFILPPGVSGWGSFGGLVKCRSVPLGPVGPQQDEGLLPAMPLPHWLPQALHFSSQQDEGELHRKLSWSLAALSQLSVLFSEDRGTGRLENWHNLTTVCLLHVCFLGSSFFFLAFLSFFFSFCYPFQ